MNGGVSQMDTFDYKPELIKRHGEKVDVGVTAAATSTPGNMMKSPFEWQQHGECGRWVTSVFPHMATQVDRLAFLMAMASKTNVHGPGSYMQNTVSARGFLMASANSATTFPRSWSCRTIVDCPTTTPAIFPQDFCRPRMPG
jgi:hypothetical protein